MKSVGNSERKSHAVLDLPSRKLKGLKIERIIGLEKRKQPFRLLEIGTGSGGIAYYFAKHEEIKCEVWAVDVVDQRAISEGYRFETVNDITLPFQDGFFDVVLSNHVIEHVGDRETQQDHILEIKRVMMNDGIGYLAVPNRWMVKEPHYSLSFLSWMPKKFRNRYLKFFRGVDFYDCEPLSKSNLEEMLGNSGLEYRNVCALALRETLSIESNHSFMARMIGGLPDFVLERLQCVFPTLIYLIDRKP